MNKPLEPRDAIRFKYKDKNVTGVVLLDDFETKRWAVVYGTRTERNQLSVFVRNGTPAGKMLDLTEPTYFYPEHIVYLNRDTPLRNVGRASPGLWFELRRLLRHCFDSKAVQELAAQVVQEEIAEHKKRARAAAKSSA